MKNRIKWIVIFALIVMIPVMSLWGLNRYYHQYVPVNTWINGEYCTGESLDDISRKYAGEIQRPIVTLYDFQEHPVKLCMDDLTMHVDYSKQLSLIQQKDGQLYWIKRLWEPARYVLDQPYISFEKEEFTTLIRNLEFVKKLQNEQRGVSINANHGTYSLIDYNRHRIDVERFIQGVWEIFETGTYEIHSGEIDCFYNEEDSKRDSEMRSLWEMMEKSYRKISFDMGDEQIVLTKDQVFSLFQTENDLPVLSEDGKLHFDREKINLFIDELLAPYNTADSILSFQATRGEEVQVPYVTYGTRIAMEEEKQYLYDCLEQNIEADNNHIPAYQKEGFVRGKNDIGNTYIEIDMTNQKMYYYVDGNIYVDTDVVTGNTGRKMGTPEGVNFVYNKQKNRVLRGSGYAAFVKYWVPVKGAIGIHDASWRDAYGGEIYKNSGSHGCINTPGAAMTKIYDRVEIGTPVVMFY